MPRKDNPLDKTNLSQTKHIQTSLKKRLEQKVAGLLFGHLALLMSKHKRTAVTNVPVKLETTNVQDR